MRLLAAKARANGLAERADVRSRVNLAVDNTLASVQIEQMRVEISISDEQLQSAYEERKAGLEEATARHILIAFEGSPAAPPDAEPLSEEAAKAKAEEIRARIVGGEDFAKVAEAESHDRGSAALGGDLGSFGRGQMVPEFEQAAFEGEVGAILPVVRTQFGYHVIQVTDRGARPLDEVRDEIVDELRSERLQAEVEALSAGLAPVFDDAFFGQGAPAAEGEDGGSASE